MPNTFVRPSSSRCSGDVVRFVAVTMSAMRPIWVAWPVAVTTNVAAPRVTCVFWNTMFVRSPSATSSPATRAGVLGHWRALAGERRLLHLERRRRDDPAVGGNHVARLEQHDIAGHELRRVDLVDAPGPTHPGVRDLQLGQRVDAGPGLHLLARCPSPC